MEKTEQNKALTFTLTVVAIILGVVLYKQFNFQTLTFKKPALAAVYGIVFIASVFILIKNARKRR